MISINTSKVKETGNLILKNGEDLCNLLDEMYTRIYNMPIVTGEWVGDSAIYFAKQAVDVDKPAMVAFGKILYDFGNNIVTAANEYKVEINKEFL